MWDSSWGTGRAESMGEHFPVSMLVLVVVFVLANVVSTWPQDIVFPEGQSDGCTLQTQGRGHCVDIHSCPDVLDAVEDTPPVLCGFSGESPMVCCAVSEENVTNPLLDISPPAVSFECGRNANNTVKLQKFSIAAHVLRPEAINHTISESNNASQEKPRARPGIPDEALDKQLKRLEELKKKGIFPAIGAVNANKSAWPWMALLGEQKDQHINWFCGGVLINDQWILTALHCFLRKKNLKLESMIGPLSRRHMVQGGILKAMEYVKRERNTYWLISNTFLRKVDIVRLGEHDYNDQNENADHEDFSVAETILYPDYTHPEAYHDLALLRLATKVTLKKYISPVCLPWGEDVNTDVTGRKVTLTGWGDTLYGGFPSSILQEVKVTVFPSSTCDKSYSSLREYSDSWPRGITDETICAGDPNGGRDACQGDSGGPIVYLNSAGRYTVAGIVSRGYGCGLKDYPGLYVNLHQPNYLAWIKKTAF